MGYPLYCIWVNTSVGLDVVWRMTLTVPPFVHYTPLRMILPLKLSLVSLV
jgi:hypothetical protein